jgi:hypothetical protein
MAVNTTKTHTHNTKNSKMATSSVASSMAQSSNHRLTRHLYRSLLRLARRYDAQPLSKSLLYRKTLPSSFRNAMETHYTKLLDTYIYRRGDVLFHPLVPPISMYRSTEAEPEVPAEPVLPFADAVKKEFRLRHTDIALSDRIDAAFTVLKKFKSVWNSYESFVKAFDSEDGDAKSDDSTRTVFDNDNRTPNSNDGAEYDSYDEVLAAHKDVELRTSSADEIKPGTILLAHPLVVGSLRRAVVLVLATSGEGSYGLVLNRPTNYTFGEAATGLPTEDILTPFMSNSIRFGGLVRRLNCIHPFPWLGGNAVPGCSDPNNPIYSSGKIDKLEEIGKESPEMRKEVIFFAG